MKGVGIFNGHLVLFYGHFGIFCDHLVYFMTIWYIFPRFGMLCREKSGNPDLNANETLFQMAKKTAAQQVFPQ
jgi:hypothetical protein